MTEHVLHWLNSITFGNLSLVNYLTATISTTGVPTCSSLPCLAADTSLTRKWSPCCGAAGSYAASTWRTASASQTAAWKVWWLTETVWRRWGWTSVGISLRWGCRLSGRRGRAYSWVQRGALIWSLTASLRSGCRLRGCCRKSCSSPEGSTSRDFTWTTRKKHFCDIWTPFEDLSLLCSCFDVYLYLIEVILHPFDIFLYNTCWIWILLTKMCFFKLSLFHGILTRENSTHTHKKVLYTQEA